MTTFTSSSLLSTAESATKGFLLFTMTGPIVLHSPLQNDDTMRDKQVEIPLPYIGISNLP